MYVHNLGATCTDSNPSEGCQQHRSMQIGVSLGIEDGHAYTPDTGSKSSEERYNGQSLLPSRVLDAVPIGVVSDMMGRQDGSSIGDCGDSTAGDEERLETVGADVGDESFHADEQLRSERKELDILTYAT